MTRQRFEPDDPREWLNRARSSLAQAKANVPGVYFEDLCFNAQQAAEKAVKAVLLAAGIEFPYVHDLARLLDLLQENGRDVPEPVRLAHSLTRFAVITRYPWTEPVGEDEYQKAIGIAEAVVQWAEDQIGGSG